MNGPELELQDAIVARLTADASVSALIGGRIFETVPKGAHFPYLTIGECDVSDASVENLDAVDCATDVHVWSKSDSWEEIKKIAAAIKKSLHELAPVLVENKCVSLRFHVTRYLRDPDGATLHGVVSFDAYLEPAD